MNAFDVGPAICSLNSGVVAIGAFEISDSVSVHHSNMSFEFGLCPEETFAMWAFQRHVDVTSAIMSLKTHFMWKELFAAVIFALQIIIKYLVSLNVFLVRMFPDGRIIAVAAFQNGFGPNVNFVSGKEMIIECIFRIRPFKRAPFFDALETPLLPVLIAHVILQCHGRLEALTAFTTDVRKWLLFIFLRLRQFSLFSITQFGAELFVRSETRTKSELLTAFSAEEQSSPQFRLEHAVISMKMVAEMLTQHGDKAAEVTTNGEIDPHVAVVIEKVRAEFKSAGVIRLVLAERTVIKGAYFLALQSPFHCAVLQF